MWQKIEDKQTWNDLIGSQSHARFLQSWEWGEFQASHGRKVLRFSWNNELLVQAIKMPLPFGKNYWYIPHAPVVVPETEDAFSAVNELADELGQHGALFLRVDPISRIDPTTEEQKQKRSNRALEFVPATQPTCTRVLDLSLSPEDLLAQMHQKTRYNIRLAKKKGVKVSEGSIEEFIKLNRETKERDAFTTHADEYYEKMISSLPSGFVKIWQATYQSKVIASNIIISFGDTITYTHGASSNEYREAMAPYILHWEIIKQSKLQGIKYYDFWGVNPEDKTTTIYKKSWEGISRFKAGFGGELICYPHSFDLIYRKGWYRLYRLLRKLKNLI